MRSCIYCGNERKPGQRICRECHAKYMREHRKTAKGREIRRGVEMMRGAAIQAFARIGNREMNGFTAVQIVSELIVPRETSTGRR